DDVVAQLLLDAFRGGLQGPAHAQSVSRVHDISSSQVSSRRGPKPVPPLVRSPRSTSERPTPAMSRCAQRRAPTNSRRNNAAVIDPPPADPPAMWLTPATGLSMAAG